MEEVNSKKQLAIRLSKLTQIEGVNRGLEQYQTDSELAADVLWNAYMLGDIGGNFVYDLGCGNGILGIGSLMLGAEQGVLIEIDTKAAELAKQNGFDFKEKCTVVNIDLLSLSFESPDDRAVKNIIIMNPPFGTKTEHADRDFLKKGFEFGDVIYSIHKTESKGFLEKFSEDEGFRITNTWNYEFGIKRSHTKHKKDNYKVAVICVRFEKK